MGIPKTMARSSEQDLDFGSAWLIKNTTLKKEI